MDTKNPETFIVFKTQDGVTFKAFNFSKYKGYTAKEQKKYDFFIKESLLPFPVVQGTLEEIENSGKFTDEQLEVMKQSNPDLVNVEKLLGKILQHNQQSEQLNLFYNQTKKGKGIIDSDTLILLVASKSTLVDKIKASSSKPNAIEITVADYVTRLRSKGFSNPTVAVKILETALGL